MTGGQSPFPEVESCAMIAEVAQAHDGDSEAAHAYIDAAANAGAHGVKFQTHLAAAESTPEEPWRVKFSDRDATRYDYWKRMEFSPGQWEQLRGHTLERGLLFVCSPFSVEAVEMMSPMGVDAWKIASGELGTWPLLEKIAAAGAPVLLSSGMSPWAEIDTAVEQVCAHDLPLVVMQCTSVYPTPARQAGLNVLSEMKRRYGCAVGLSDHSGAIYAGLAAAVLGAAVLEVHVAFARTDPGPDVPSSVTFDELEQLVRGVGFLTEAASNPVDKDALAGELQDLRRTFTKSIVAARALLAGTVLKETHLALKKPGTGLGAARLSGLVGKTLKRDLEVDEQLAEEDLA